MSLIDDRSKRLGQPVLPACASCGFGLFIPIAALTVSQVRLYDDARFPGRLIVSLVDHHEQFDEVPARLAAQFSEDLRHASRALRSTGSVTRVNIAILGNQEPHVHAHLVPRSELDPLPHKSPWQDPRPQIRLASAERERLVDDLATLLNGA